MVFLIPQQYSEVCKQPLDVLKSYKIMHPVENRQIFGHSPFMQLHWLSQSTVAKNSPREL